MLDFVVFVVGIKYCGQFEEWMKVIMNELEKLRDVILFIDEIYIIVGVGGVIGSLDVFNIFKFVLVCGELQCIGVFILDEYCQYIEKDGVFDCCFQKVIVDLFFVEEVVNILDNICLKYEEFYNVNYFQDVIEVCVKFSDCYISDCFLFDKVIDVFDEVGVWVYFKNIYVFEYIEELEKKIEEFKDQKNQVVKNQQYEKVVDFWDKEFKFVCQLEFVKIQWEEEVKIKCYFVSEEDIVEVVFMMIGILVWRVV